MKKRKKNNTKNNKTNRIYYWITAIVIIISLIILSKIIYTIYKRQQKEEQHSYAHLEKMRKKTEALKINFILNEYKDYAFGIDISKHQGNIIWDSLNSISTNHPISFVFVRATRGRSYQDNTFQKNWNYLKKKEIIKGAYHYYNPNQNSTEQAKNFIKTVSLEEGDLPPVLDIEELPNNRSLEFLKEGILNWLELIENEYKVKPIIYSNDAYFIHHIGSLELSNYPIWVANYNPIKNPLHERWSFWQFSEKGIIKGITANFVDLNVFNGDIDDLKAMTIKQ